MLKLLPGYTITFTEQFSKVNGLNSDSLIVSGYIRKLLELSFLIIFVLKKDTGESFQTSALYEIYVLQVNYWTLCQVKYSLKL